MSDPTSTPHSVSLKRPPPGAWVLGWYASLFRELFRPEQGGRAWTMNKGWWSRVPLVITLLVFLWGLRRAASHSFVHADHLSFLLGAVVWLTVAMWVASAGRNAALLGSLRGLSVAKAATFLFATALLITLARFDYIDPCWTPVLLAALHATAAAGRFRAPFVAFPVAGLLIVLGLPAIHENVQRSIVNHFHRLYYHRDTYNNTTWMGVPVQKCPLDLWIFQEIVHETRPDVIVEAGTYKGGSAFFLASILDAVGHGQVVSIDIVEHEERPDHPRVHYLLGSSTSEEIVDQVKLFIREGDTVMVALDSDHRRDHVLDELRIYSELVTVGSYLIVEDTHFNGNPILPGWGPGPNEALQAFLAEDDRFVADQSREKLLLSFNRGGYLLRKQ